MTTAVSGLSGMLVGAIFKRLRRAAAGSRKLTVIWPGDNSRPDNEQED